MTPSSRRSTISCGSRSTPPRSREHGGRVEQVEADDRAGVVVGPRAAERGDELVLALHPVRLGVDERAVHVPQDGRRRARATAGRRSTPVYSWTSSISVPKLPFGWTKATVVPRLPGRGASSIGVAPAATIASAPRRSRRRGSRRGAGPRRASRWYLATGESSRVGVSELDVAVGDLDQGLLDAVAARRPRGGATVGAERPLVVVDGGLEVADGDGDVVDLGEQQPPSWQPSARSLCTRRSDSARGLSVPAEEGDLVLADALALLGVVDAEALARAPGSSTPSLPSCSLRWTGTGGLADVRRAGSTADSTGWIRPWSISRLASHASS